MRSKIYLDRKSLWKLLQLTCNPSILMQSYRSQRNHRAFYRNPESCRAGRNRIALNLQSRHNPLNCTELLKIVPALRDPGWWRSDPRLIAMGGRFWGQLGTIDCILWTSQDFGAILRSPGNLVAIQFDCVDCSRNWRPETTDGLH